MTNSAVLLALVADHDRTVLAYATDGQSIAEWFQGPFQGETLDLTNAAGSRLQATFTAQGAGGMLTLPGGSPLAFQIAPTIEPAGLYISKKGANAEGYKAGWVLLADGRQAGVLENGSVRQAAPRLDPAHPTISLPNGGTLIAGIVVPPSSLDD